MPIYVALAGAIAPVLSRQCRWGGRDSMEITMFWLSNDSIDGMLLEIMGKFTFVCWCFQHFWFLTLLDFLPSHKEQVILVVRGSQPKTLDQRKYALLVMKDLNKQTVFLKQPRSMEIRCSSSEDTVDRIASWVSWNGHACMEWYMNRYCMYPPKITHIYIYTYHTSRYLPYIYIL